MFTMAWEVKHQIRQMRIKAPEGKVESEPVITKFQGSNRGLKTPGVDISPEATGGCHNIRQRSRPGGDSRQTAQRDVLVFLQGHYRAGCARMWKAQEIVGTIAYSNSEAQ